MNLIARRKARLRPHSKTFLIMKLAVVLLLMTCLHANAEGLGQNITLSERNVPLKKVLNAIKRQSGCSFFYEDKMLERSRPVTVNIQNQPLEQALEIVFRDQPLTFQILGKVIALRERTEPVTNISATASAPLFVSITGVVRDEAGAPLEGASVSVKNGTATTLTKADGSFQIEVPDNNAVLLVSYVGFTTREITVGDRRSITVVLSRAVAQLENLVVIGYGTQRKRDVTGTITSVSGDEIAKLPNINPVASLQGKVPGLTVVNSGRAGSSPTVRIRGVNSTNNTNPLYVVDGVFQTNIDYLNPGDIESIEVLRDPSSIAIFGLQGGNGVIIVTTKRAPRGKTMVTFQTNVGVQTVPHVIDVVDAEGFKKLYDAQAANTRVTTPGYQNFDYTNYTANTDWQKEILRNAAISNSTLTLSHSGEKSTTLFSIGYNYQEGVLKYDKYKRYVARLNQTLNVSENVRVGGDLTGSYWDLDPPTADLNNALWAVPIVPIQSPSGLYYTMPESIQRAQVGNPVANMERTRGTSLNRGYRAVGSIFGEVKFLKNFTWRSSFYADLGFNQSRSYTPLPYRLITLGEPNRNIKTDTTFNDQARTSVAQSQATFRKFQQDHILTYDKTINRHKVTATLGFTTLFEGSEALGASRRDTSLNIPFDPNLWYVDVVNNNNPTFNNGSGSEQSFMSFLSRVNYSFAGKYLVSATYRRDGSSKFAPANRWGDFGSIGLGWVVSEEDFFDNVEAINFLKLRAAWGTVGSALGLAPNLFLPGLTTANVGVFGDNVYGSVAPAYIPDPNLHWEVVRGIDAGLEFRTFSNRLTGDITLYDRTTKDIITTLTLLGTAGNFNYRTNLGTISNKGVELSFGWSDKIGRDLNYRINVNGSYNKNRVESIGPDVNFEILGNSGVNKTVTGESIGFFYGYVQTGIYQSVADMDKMPTMISSLPGDISYADINGDGKIDGQDRTNLGSPFPTWNFGGSVQLMYKGFDVLVEGQGVAGNKIFTHRRRQTFATLNYEANRLNAWTGPGTSNIEPILDNNRGNNFLASTYFLEPGDYFRIRTLQLGYNFSPKSLGNYVKQLRVYVSGQNIKTFTKATGYTPEVSLGNPIASGVDNGTYPVPAIYSFGVNVTF
jgi:TonB-linked SusC/RagA family outer membrane protein